MRDVSKALFQLWLLSWLLTSFLPLALMASSVFDATCRTRRQFHVSIKTARAAPFSLCLSASSFSHWSPLSSSSSGALLRPEWNGKRPQPHLINVFASPRRVDFSLTVNAVLCIIDGAVVVVDCIEVCAVQTVTFLRHALAERVIPNLFVIKVLHSCSLSSVNVEVAVEILEVLFSSG